MAKEQSRWESEILEKMSTNRIEAKMKTLVAGFGLKEFKGKTDRYLSCEDLSKEEYYAHAKTTNLVDGGLGVT